MLRQNVRGRIWMLNSKAKRDGPKMNVMVTKDKYTTTVTMMSMAEDRERKPDRIIQQQRRTDTNTDCAQCLSLMDPCLCVWPTIGLKRP
jgi:ERCC4-type nuclease